jgi:alpha-D-ribose 1-methylphosphonate 5-triphosphate diphosphatase
MTGLFIDGGRTLLGQDIAETSLQIGDGVIADIGSDAPHGALGLDASDLLVLPGIVDLHGDAFERQLMPRPGVDFPVDVALIDSDRQAIANGITTVFHGTTWSWEPGLRGAENARKLLDAIETLRPKLASDTRFHLRQETFNLDAEDEIVGWLQAGRIDLLAFNDHMDIAGISKPAKRARMVERTGLSSDAFDQLVDRVLSRTDEVPASIARLAKAANAAGVPTLSHDDATPAMRDDFRKLGVNIAEFPINEETAQGRRRGRRLHRVRRAQCGARRQPYRLDQGVRHDRQGPLLGAGVGLLLSRAIAGRVPAGPGWHPVAAAGLGADLVRTGQGCRAHRPRRDRGRAPRRSPARR